MASIGAWAIIAPIPHLNSSIRTGRSKARAAGKCRVLSAPEYVLLILVFCVADTAYSDSTAYFEIERQSLTTALLEYGRQAGLSIGFTEEMTAGKIAPALSSQTSSAEALHHLLKGSGLVGQFIDASTVAIDHDPEVSAQAGRRAEDNQVDATAGSSSSVALPGSEIPAENLAGLKAQPEQVIDEVLVVGSQIVGAQVSDYLPVTVWDARRISATGATHGGDLFRSLPFAGAVSFNGVDTFFAGVNSARGDIASINLRDLGTGNTLVLLNGRRMVLHPGVQTENRVPAMTANMNILPLHALQRIEVLRDGASAVYGADAVAGVINNVLLADFDGLDISVGYGESAGTSLSETELSILAGGHFNDGRTHLQLIAAGSGVRGVDAAERHYAQSSNLLPLVAGSAFAGDANFRNTSISGAWGQFLLPVAVQQNGIPITSPAGIFHVQPPAFGDCATPLNENACIDDGFIDFELYGDNNSARQLIPDLRRSTLILSATQSMTNNIDIYGELLLYQAKSKRRTGGSAPLSSTPITIPARNYWNPFGPVTFSDGTPNPNRLEGINAPADGLDITINSSFFGSAYRIADAGHRAIEVGNSSFRAISGIQGAHSGWQWDSAILHSAAQTRDVTFNRVSNTLFQASLALETPLAYNPFNGSSAAYPGSVIDGNPNPRAVIEPFLVDVARKNRTTLTLADFKISKANAWQVEAGPVGAAMGIEIRREHFSEDRDNRFDGTTTFTDLVTGQTFASDIVGTSVSADSNGSRNVLSTFGELAIPLVNESREIAFINSLDLQIAARFEEHSDTGEIFQPRISLSWRPLDAFMVRGSYSRGVRVPNLPQVNASTTRRVLVATDWYRCQALLNRGVITSLAACGPAGQVLVESSRSGSLSLRPEDYVSQSVGLVLTPGDSRDIFATLDYWRVEQKGIVGLFGAENQLAADYAARLSGNENALVMRADLSQADRVAFAGSGLPPAGQVLGIQDSYVNLDRRTSKGLDLSVSYGFSFARVGDLSVALDATHLLSVDQLAPPAAIGINALKEPAIAILGAGDLLQKNSRPRWKAAAMFALSRPDWTLGATANFVSEFQDTSAVNDANGEFFTVDQWLTFGTFIEFSPRFPGNSIRSVKFGVRNVFDRDPPLADESFGFNAAMHDSLGRYWYMRIGAGF